jgi:hypothetical protein
MVEQIHEVISERSGKLLDTKSVFNAEGVTE